MLKDRSLLPFRRAPETLLNGASGLKIALLLAYIGFVYSFLHPFIICRYGINVQKQDLQEAKIIAEISESALKRDFRVQRLSEKPLLLTYWLCLV